jgi:hypothetical protein
MCRATPLMKSDEVKDIRDKASAIEAYSRQARNTEAEWQACEIRLRAERKCGQLLAEREKAKASPGNQYTGKLDSPQRGAGPKTLEQLGVSKRQSERWQKLAAVPKDTYIGFRRRSAYFDLRTSLDKENRSKDVNAKCPI